MNPKSKIQSQAVKLSKKHRFLCLEWSTGTGKTLAAVRIVEQIIKDNPEATGYLICKESTHKKNWVDEIEKHGKSSVLKNTKTILYASLSNQNLGANYVILDECHALTPLRIKHLRQVLQKGTRIIFLSATIHFNKKKLMNDLCKEVHYYRIPLMKAIQLNLVPKPELIVHQIRLKEGEQQNHYDELSGEMEKYKDLSEDVEMSTRLRDGCRDKWLNVASQRKKYIAEVKTEALLDLVKSFRLSKSRFICFTGSIEQSKILGAESSVHSKNSNKVNQKLIDCFNEMGCTELFAVKMLREGINLTQIEKGVITQLDSEIGSFFQMLGRCLRHEFPEMHLFVLQDTQDVVYFKKSMKNFNKEFITWV